MTGGTQDEDGGERRSRRARTTRDRRGRTTATPDGNPRARTRRTRTRAEGEAQGRSNREAESDRRAAREEGGSWSRSRRSSSAASPDEASPKTTTGEGTTSRAGSARRGEPRDRTRRRGEPARPDRATRERAGRTGRDAGRPTTRRSRSDAVRPRRTETGERPPPTRARYLTRRLVAVLVALTVVGVAYLVMFTSVLGVRSVEVVGVKEIPVDSVVKAAAIEPGTPMVRLDADEAAARVARLPRVFEVRVERSWPSTVEIIITERAPVAVLRAGGKAHLVDETGLDYATVTTPPVGLPTLAISNVHPDDPATKAAVTVLGAIPKQLKTQVTTVTADTPGDVRLTLGDGRVVKWGNAQDNARKAAVLAALLTRPGTTYDVATPDFPTVSG